MGTKWRMRRLDVVLMNSLFVFTFYVAQEGTRRLRHLSLGPYISPKENPLEQWRLRKGVVCLLGPKYEQRRHVTP